MSMQLYHGSPIHGITEFSVETVARFELVEGQGIYLTSDYRVARSYAGSSGCVYLCSIKNGAIFDATDENEFKELFKSISKKIRFNLLELPYIEHTIQGLVSGQYQISDDNSSGLFWQIRNLLLNDESFCSQENYDDSLTTIKEQIMDYLSQHPVLKYNDKTLGLVLVCRDPSVLKISEEVVVGSDEDLALL